MIYAIAGLPSRFSEWCETVLAALVSASGANADLLVADSLAMLGEQLLARDSLTAVIVTRQPLRSLCDALLATPRAPMVVLDEPDHAVSALIADYGLSYAEATRRVANALTALIPLIRDERVLVLRGASAAAPEQSLRSIAAHFALSVDDSAVAQILHDHPPRPTAVAVPEPYAMTPLSGFGSLSMPSCDLALQPLWQHLRDGTALDILWSPHLFFRPDKEDVCAPIALTGRGRSLVYGPYIRLPEGPWSCRVAFASSADAADTQMLAEIYGGEVLNSARFVLHGEGDFEMEFGFVNPDSDTALELRLFTAAASFDGSFVLEQVRLTALSAPRITVQS